MYTCDRFMLIYGKKKTQYCNYPPINQLKNKKSSLEHHSLYHPENGIVELAKSWSNAVSPVLMALSWNP